MDSPPKLYDMAFKVVVDYYTTDFLQTKVIPADSIVGDQIFETVMKIRNHRYDSHAIALIREFKPSKLELDLKNCRQASFSLVRKLKLTELKLRWFDELEKYKVRVAEKEPYELLTGSSRTSAKTPSYSTQFSIAQFLADILSLETKRELRVLDISGHEPFRDNWMEVLPSMFPKLEVLMIKHRELTEENFGYLCNYLPNLHTLHIGHYKIKNLDGISKLQNLKNLVIGYTGFRKKTDVDEIFSLRNLKSLTIYENSHPDWNDEFFFLKPLPELTHLEIHWRKADDEFLKEILPNLPKLKSVVANKTKIQGYTAPPSLTIYINTNLDTIMESLAYFRTTGNQKLVLEALLKLTQIYRRSGEICEPHQLTVCLNETELLLETFKFDEKVVKKVNECVDIFACFAVNGEHLNDNKLKVLNLLLKNLAFDLEYEFSLENISASSILGFVWEKIRKLILKTENVNIDKIASLAMESIIHGGRSCDHWQYSCAVALAEIIDRTDFSSGYYKESSFRKLHKCLVAMYKKDKNDYWHQECRTSVRKVMEYIEIFM